MEDFICASINYKKCGEELRGRFAFGQELRGRFIAENRGFSPVLRFRISRSGYGTPGGCSA